MKYQLLLVIAVITVLLSGCIGNTLHEVTIIENYPAEHIVKTTNGDILPVDTWVDLGKIEVGHTYIVKMGNVRFGSGIVDITTGIVEIIREVDIE